MQYITIHPIEQGDHLVFAADIDVVVHLSVTEEFHANAGSEVESRVGADQTPGPV